MLVYQRVVYQRVIIWDIMLHTHDGSMVLVYMLTWLGYIDGIYVTIYTSTMDPMGNSYTGYYITYIFIE